MYSARRDIGTLNLLFHPDIHAIFFENLFRIYTELGGGRVILIPFYRSADHRGNWYTLWGKAKNRGPGASASLA